MSKRCILCQRPRNTGLHELPSEPVLRQKWLDLVPEDEFPRFNANPKVCALHFKPEDYNPDQKNRILRKGVVPNFTPREDPNDDYTPGRKKRKKGGVPVFTLNENTNELETQIVVVDSTEIPEDTTEVAVTTSSEDPSSVLQNNTSHLNQHGEKLKQTKVLSKEERKIEILKAQIGHLKVENREKANKLKSLSSRLKELKTVSYRQASELRSKDKSIRQLEVKVKRFEKLHSNKDLGSTSVKDKIEKEREAQVRKIRNLKEQVAMLSTERKEMEQICYYKNIEEMILNMDTDRKAAFILDQIRLYKMKLPRYADSTLQECIIWEDSDPRGYQFVRESELLTLPSQNTMKKHLGPMDVEINVDDNLNNPSITVPIGEVKESSVGPTNIEINEADKSNDQSNRASQGVIKESPVP